MSGQQLSSDWYPGSIPDNASIDPTAYIETSYSFLRFASQLAEGARIGRGASIYKSTMLDVGLRGRVTLGDYALVHGARIICDSSITIGSHALISWNVVLMDSYRVPLDPDARRHSLEALAAGAEIEETGIVSRPITIADNVWIGGRAVVFPGVTIGEGSIVSACAVVAGDVPAYSIVAGNPARRIGALPAPQRDCK